MNFIVVGCGRVGAELSFRLFKSGHQVWDPPFSGMVQKAIRTRMPNDLFLGKAVGDQQEEAEGDHDLAGEHATGLPWAKIRDGRQAL